MKRFDFAKTLLVLSLCLASFAYGFASARYKIYPYSLLDEAEQAAVAIYRAYTLPDHAAGANTFKPIPISQLSLEYGLQANEQKTPDGNEKLEKPYVRNFAGVENRDLILVCGGRGYMQPLSTKDGCLAWLMDREGDVKHVWQYDNSLWDDLKQVVRPPGTGIMPIGLYVYPNGDLLATFQGGGCWPYGIGIAKFDVDSNLLWKYEHLNHHWFSVADDGRIYTSAHRVVESPYVLGDTNAQLAAKEGKLLSDILLILSPDGEPLEEVSLLDAFAEAGWVGLFQGATEPEAADRPSDRVETVSWDPLHLNEVRVVTQEQARSFPMLKAGDVLLSFRSINTIGILDGETKRFKWVCAGGTLRQHSPRLYEGGILVFDNWGGPSKTGGSRLARIDLTTRLPSTVFPRLDLPLPDHFFTFNTGRIDLHPEGGRVLATITNQGALWEIDLATGKVLWEYVYTHPDQGGHRFSLATAEYAPRLEFRMNRAEGLP
ncbi:MAG: arylsulfotransferase family protein [Planctomycetaceae bacterium]